jgi:hypothetical protein
MDPTTHLLPNLDPTMLQNDPLRLPPFHFDAPDPDPTLHFDADPDPDPAFNFAADPDQAFHFDADPDPVFLFDADSDPVFHFDADPDPASQSNSDPSGSGIGGGTGNCSLSGAPVVGRGRPAPAHVQPRRTRVSVRPVRRGIHLTALPIQAFNQVGGVLGTVLFQQSK